MRILICGGHNFDDRDKLAATLNRLHDERRFVLVITSGARGADTLAEEWANARGLACHRVVPWTPRTRNQRMLDEGRPEIVVAFPGGIGTADMVRRARSAGIEVIEIEPHLLERGLCRRRAVVERRRRWSWSWS